jgi:hypothetical protein
MPRSLPLAVLAVLAVASAAAGCTGRGDASTAPTDVTVALHPIAATTSTTLPSTPPETTTRGTVQVMEGGDGTSDDHHAADERYPPVPADIDLSPLPQAITETQGRTNPGSVARQWAGVKVLTSGVLDGPLWPLSVGAHLPALSDPAGHWIPNGQLQRVDLVDKQQLDHQTATAEAHVEILDEIGTLTTIIYDIELWLSDDGYWLVAFAEVRP